MWYTNIGYYLGLLTFILAIVLPLFRRVRLWLYTEDIQDRMVTMSLFHTFDTEPDGLLIGEKLELLLRYSRYILFMLFIWAVMTVAWPLAIIGGAYWYLADLREKEKKARRKSRY